MPRTVALALCLALAACAEVRAVEMTTIAYRDGPGADPVRHRLDLYRPGGGRDLPVLVFFHGGVWQRGSKDQYRNIGEAFAQRGILTAVANYRLSPEVRHPAHVQDAAAAVAWLVRHAEEFGARPDRIFLAGHSAGGHLVTLLLFDRQYLQAEGVDAESLGGVIPLSGIFDLTKPIDDTPEGGFVEYIYPPFGDDPEAQRAASPVSHLRSTRVPILVIVAGEDYRDMRAQSEYFVAELSRRGVAARFETIAGHGHFELVERIGEPGDPTTDLVSSFVRQENGTR